MSGRDSIFQRIRAAVTPLPERAAYPDYDDSAAFPIWLGDNPDPALLFRQRLEATGGRFFDAIEDVAEWLKIDGAKKLYLAPALRDLAPRFEGLIEVTFDYHRDAVDEIDAGMTPAAGGIAESGTVILSDAGTPDRLGALAPWRHVAVLRRADLHRTISEAIATLPRDPNVIWVTGPSKTADVEGILIQGVHGPGQQACLLI